MVKSISYPGEEGVHAEEGAFLAKKIELRVTVEKSGRDKLITDPHCKGGQNCEEDVVEGQRPGLVDDLA